MNIKYHRFYAFFIFVILSMSLFSSLGQGLKLNEDASVDIASITNQQGGFSIELVNTGETIVRGLRLMINVTGGWFKPIDFRYNQLLFACNCTDVFEPGDSFFMSTTDVESFFGFGPIQITVETSSFATGKNSVTQKAFLFGSYLLFF